MLQRLLLRLKTGNERRTSARWFWAAEFSTQGTQFVPNGRKMYIRADLRRRADPRTGHPPTDVESWKRVMLTCKEYGLNCIRFHSLCPPEAAFFAADETGMYCIVDCGTWPGNGSASLGDGKPVDQWAYDETDRILKAYGNHPSFVLMMLGC